MADISYEQLLKNLKDIQVVRIMPTFVSHTILQGGRIHDRIDAHACWYYCRCAMGMVKEIRLGAQYEGENDHIDMLNNLARSVAALYNLESPSRMLRNMIDCKLEAERCELEWDPRIEKPWLSAYINGGEGSR